MRVQNSIILPHCSVVIYFLRSRIDLRINKYYHIAFI